MVPPRVATCVGLVDSKGASRSTLTMPLVCDVLPEASTASTTTRCTPAAVRSSTVNVHRCTSPASVQVSAVSSNDADSAAVASTTVKLATSVSQQGWSLSCDRDNAKPSIDGAVRSTVMCGPSTT